MSSIGDQIVAAMVTALNTSTPAGLPASELDRYDDVVLEASSNPKANLVYQVEDDEQPAGSDDAPVQQHEMTVGIRHLALGTSSTTPAQEADKLYAWSVKALTDQRFGNLVIHIRPKRRVWARPKEPIATRQAEIRSLWRVRFISKAADAELRA